MPQNTVEQNIVALKNVARMVSAKANDEATLAMALIALDLLEGFLNDIRIIAEAHEAEKPEEDQ